MRLNKDELKSILETFKAYFGENNHLWLFGSRADDSKKGGDIDLYIETLETDETKILEQKLSFLAELKARLGDQKIDLIIKSPRSHLPIYNHAKETGIKLL